MRIQNHFRRVLEERVLKSDQATSEGWLFAIFAELHLDVARPNLWAVRNLFDRALDDPRSVALASPSLADPPDQLSLVPQNTISAVPVDSLHRL